VLNAIKVKREPQIMWSLSLDSQDVLHPCVLVAAPSHFRGQLKCQKCCDTTRPRCYFTVLIVSDNAACLSFARRRGQKLEGKDKFNGQRTVTKSVLVYI